MDLVPHTPTLPPSEQTHTHLPHRTICLCPPGAEKPRVSGPSICVCLLAKEPPSCAVGWLSLAILSPFLQSQLCSFFKPDQLSACPGDGVRKRVCFTYAILKSGSLYYMGQGKATLTPDMYHSESSPPLGTNLIWEFELEFAFNKTPRGSDLEQSSVSRLRHLRKPPNMVPRTTNVPVSQAHTTPHLEKYL